MKKALVLICVSLMLFGLWGCSAAPAEKDQTTDNEMTNTGNSSTSLQHGEKDEKGRVYVDGSAINIENEEETGAVIWGWFEIYYGTLSNDYSKTYAFVTDENEYTLEQYSYGINICIRPKDYDTTFSEKYLKYDHGGNYIGYSEQEWEDGRWTRRFMERENETIEYKFLGNGVILYTETINGVTTIKNTHKVDDKSYHDYYKNNNKEITLTYDASGTGLVGYKYVDLRDGSVYDWVLDGNGNEPENFLSVTITKNGASNTYTGRNEIPWGAAIAYPPHVAGLYE